MAKKPTSRSTKAEILAAYKELAKEKTALESQMRQLESTSKTATKSKSAEKPAMTSHSHGNSNSNSAVRVTCQQQHMNDTIDRLTQLQLGFGTCASNLSEKLSTEASKLEELRDRVDEEVAHLTELHDLSEVEDDTLHNLVTEYQQSAKLFQEELSQRRETLKQELSEAQEAWATEREERQRFVKERNEEHRKTRDREAQEYHYDLELQRRLDEEQYEATQEQLYRTLEEMQQEREKAWEERETDIADREKQFHEVKTKVEEHEGELEATIKRGKDSGRNIGHYQAKVKADLKAKEVEGQKQSYELRLQSLGETIANQEARIVSLSEQLDSALKQVQDLAVKAIEGSANANSLQAVKDIALEQAKNQPRGK
ncbi:MAG: hypothetical protein SWY16_20865 [Cyanobacteriota bacterium]|nr:hypothetical protein [Cyanobacteriota bacterium]